MKIYDLEFTVQNVVIELEPEEIVEAVVEAAVPEEAQEFLKDRTILSLAVGMPYGFQLYTEEQWESLKRRVRTFPSIMQRHMKPFFTTAVLLDAEDAESGFPQVVQTTENLAGFTHMADWPEGEQGGRKALLIHLDDDRVYILRADGKDEFMETMLEQ